MIKENKPIDCERITGITARRFHGGKEVDLPTLYTRNIMPCNRSHILTKETTRRWSHMQKIEDSLPPLQDCDVGLQNGGLFSQKTLLGWGVVGTIDMSGYDKNVFGFSHRLLAESTSFDNKSLVHVRGIVRKFPE